MALKSSTRWMIWAALAVGTAVAVMETARRDNRPVAADIATAKADATGAGKGLAPGEIGSLLENLRSTRLFGDPQKDPFGGTSRAAQAAAKTGPPPPPVFGYWYAGRMVLADGSRRTYLGLGNSVIEIHVGDELEGGFKVTAISEEAIDLRHKPSGQALSFQLSSLVASPAPSANAPSVPAPEASTPTVPTSAPSQQSAQAQDAPRMASGFAAGVGTTASGIAAKAASASPQTNPSPQSNPVAPVPSRGIASGLTPSGTLGTHPQPASGSDGISQNTPIPSGRLGM